MARQPRGPRPTIRSARRRMAAPAFEALTVEGTLIAPAQLALVAARDAGLQGEADYGVPRGLALRDEIARYFRIGQALFADLVAADPRSSGAATRFTEALLRDVLGFGDVRRVGWREKDGRRFAVTLEAGGGRVPVVVTPAADGLDRPSASLAGEGGRGPSAALALQDWLNADEGALWGLACNGERLRLIRDNPSLTRPAYIEADLRRLFEGEAFADFTALWLLLHASRFGPSGVPPSDCALERWRDAGQKAGVAARDRLRDGVEAALQALGDGFVRCPSNADLRLKLESGELPLPAFHGLLLRLVYRMIFLLVAEDRGLLHPPEASPAGRTLYREGYGLSRLRDRAIRRSAWDAHDDLWDGLLIVFEALGTRGEPALGLPTLDGLFARGGLGELEASVLPNKALMAAIYRLAWLKDEGALAPVNWRDMEPEELGSVYESLLELTPRLADDGRGYGFAEGAETKGNQRKTTGSYYTPDSLVQVLLDSALDPVLDRVEREADDPAEALLGVSVIDPACGSGHFLLAAARRIATRVARARAGGTASAADYRHALRDVARRCIHGVDRNPMAVELTKVALWIETVEPGRPLGFLDANIRCGDALLGVFDLDALAKGIPGAAYKPLAGDDKAAARALFVRNRAEREGQGALDFAGGGGRLPPTAPLARADRDWRALTEDSPAEIAERRARFEAARADPRAWSLRVACDLYVAAFLAPKPAGAAAIPGTATVPTTGDIWRRMTGGPVCGPREGKAVDLACEARAFHWPLEFPDVMAAGGFDVVLGNPPWERIKLQEKEFFAPRELEIAAAPNAAARGRMIAELAAAEAGSRERALFESFEQAKRTAEASSLIARVPGDEGGRFALTGRGDVNTYALFAELFANLANPRGWAGIIVPTGIATDATTAPFFAALVADRRLARLFDFENRARIFPSVYFRVKFCLLTLGRDCGTAAFAFFLTDTAQLSEPERRFTLSSTDISRINPNTNTAPVFRAREDARLTAKIYGTVPVLIREIKPQAVNPWGLSFMAMFHMSNDSNLFRTASQLQVEGLERIGTDWVKSKAKSPAATFDTVKLGDRTAEDGHRLKRWVPLYEAKMVHQFNHRYGDFKNLPEKEDTDYREIPQADATVLGDTRYEPTTRYWVPASDVEDRLSDKRWKRDWLIGFRDITNATNERTFIATVIPRAGVNHKMPLAFMDQPVAFVAALIGNWSSLIFDYVTRQKVGGTSMTYFYVKQFPVLPPSVYTPADLTFIVPRVLELTYNSWVLQPFARDLGHEGPPFIWEDGRRARLRAELDAWYARAYGLTRNELRYVLDPADIMGDDYPSETFRVLKESELRRFGEYRTQRLVLEAWDEQEASRGDPVVIPAVVLPRIHPSSRPDADWTRPAAAGAAALRFQTRAQVAAILKSLNGPTSAQEVRLAALFALEPRFLTARLTGAERAHWRRVVGAEADPPTAGVVAFGLVGASGWGEALQQLEASNALIINGAQGTWAQGPGLTAYMAIGWTERAGFALDLAARILSDQSAILTADEANGLAVLAA